MKEFSSVDIILDHYFNMPSFLGQMTLVGSTTTWQVPRETNLHHYRRFIPGTRQFHISNMIVDLKYPFLCPKTIFFLSLSLLFLFLYQKKGKDEFNRSTSDCFMLIHWHCAVWKTQTS